MTRADSINFFLTECPPNQSPERPSVRPSPTLSPANTPSTSTSASTAPASRRGHRRLLRKSGNLRTRQWYAEPRHPRSSFRTSPRPTNRRRESILLSPLPSTGHGPKTRRKQKTNNSCFSLFRLGHDRCPPRSSAEQEGVGTGYQGRAFQTPGPHLAEAKRRGGRQGEALQLRRGSERQEPQGPTNCDRGRVKGGVGCKGNDKKLTDYGLVMVQGGIGLSEFVWHLASHYE